MALGEEALRDAIKTNQLSQRLMRPLSKALVENHRAVRQTTAALEDHKLVLLPGSEPHPALLYSKAPLKSSLGLNAPCHRSFCNTKPLAHPSRPLCLAKEEPEC